MKAFNPVPMLTIEKLVAALKAIRSNAASATPHPGTIFVIANETLKEVEPEIEAIKNPV